MHPKKISIFIIVALVILFGMTFLSSPNTDTAEKRVEGFTIYNTTIKYPTTRSFLSSRGLSKEKTAEVDSIVANIEQILTEEEATHETTVKPQIPDFSKIDTAKIERIAYPGTADVFIQKLKKQLQASSCRIIHYGDSQLEGDRISAYLRNRLQRLYGGGGPGFIPIKQVYQQVSADVVPSDNWLRYAAFNPKQEKFSHKKYGVYTSISRFTSPYQQALDSIDLDTIPYVKASINIGLSKKSYAKLRKFSRIGLHYGNAKTPVGIKIFNNGVLIQEDSLATDGKYHNYPIQLSEAPTKLSIELEAKISPDFYGLTLDNNTGILLDNVAMRGASGTIFAGLNSGNFKTMLSELDPKILIFQYGGNTVPYLKDSLGVENYTKYVLGNINWIRRKIPQVSILFIGPSDMTTTENGNFKTYELLPYLNEKLKTICLNNAIAYWSMYDAMGGKNSMQHWVDQKLASTDYTHFTASGTKVISELFFTALYLDLTQ